MMHPPASTSPMRPQQTKRPSSAAMIRPARSTSRQSMVSRPDALTPSGSKASDEDARTAVRVAIRVRPPLQPADPGFDLIPQRFRRSTCEVTGPSDIVIQSTQGKKLFVFDRVFGEQEDQQAVWNYINDSIDSFVQGYNVSVLAYGQSGAGKSYTMGTSGPGEQGHASTRGIVPRAAHALFERLTTSGGQSNGQRSGLRSPQRYSTHGLPTLASFSKLPAQEKTWQLKATYVEIYNESLRDLLISEDVPLHERPQPTIREDTKGRILLTNLHQVDIDSVEDLLNALNFGSSIRQTDATAINAQSSRSHAIFSLNLVQRRSASQSMSRIDKRRSVPVEPLSGVESTVTVDSKLHFVDLAGSERLKNTGAQGDRAKEGISINAGLASLGKVISQLSSRHQAAHVSYRDSKLTRMLQDSLGGNAITYMIACINPAEFHLSETLNTVTYAQRARAIQSKPTIQQSLSEGDKTALIERLKAEIAFLREQVTSDRSAKRSASPERTEKVSLDLQNQLMDMQENYDALCQRHESLIVQLGKSSHGQSVDFSDGPLTGSAVDRLQRSTNFAEAVENVVLEYEKTIQSLESSLANTRTSLSSTESSLMERESKIAYLEAAVQQNQKRIQKMSDREAHTEQYLQELEGQLEGVTSNEESTATLISGLRKELSRAKDNQMSTEEYITALEDKLAEAEQDHEIMKRELDRLEHVVERQRNLGRLDRTTPQVDTLAQAGAVQPIMKSSEMINGFHPSNDDPYSLKGSSPPSPLGNDMTGFEGHPTNGDVSPISPLSDNEAPQTAFPAFKSKIQAPSEVGSRAVEDQKQAAQSSFMADKLETLTQELFDLRGEHEITINDFDELRRKYAIALQTLAKLQDSDDKAGGNGSPDVDAPPQRSDSFLGGTMPGAPPQHMRGPSSPSASSAYSSQQDSKSSGLANGTSTTPRQNLSPSDSEPSQVPLPPSENESPAGETSPPAMDLPDVDVQELQSNHDSLMQVHRETLAEVDYLKAELQRLHSSRASSPALKSPLVRRKPSQDLVSTMNNIDRANRSFASLRNIALDHFESNATVRQNFEHQLNTIMAELHSRTERAQELEVEMITLRRQLDEKLTIITGLTRERSTLKASSNVDFSAVSGMQTQLLQSEQQIKGLQESHANQERELQAEIATLKRQMETHLSAKQAADGEAQQRSVQSEEQTSKLHAEIADWQERHNAATKSMKDTESSLLGTIAQLEASLKSAIDSHLASTQQHERALKDATTALDSQKSEHNDAISRLQQDIQSHLESGQQQSERLAELEKSHNEALRNLDEGGIGRQVIEGELAKQRGLTQELQGELYKHKDAIREHESALQDLKANHEAELDRAYEAESAFRMENETMKIEHERALTDLSQQVKNHQMAKAELCIGLAGLLGRPTDHANIHSHVQDLINSKRDLEVEHTAEKRELEDELRFVHANNTDLQGRVDELKQLHDEALRNAERISEKEKKSSRLVQELEDQLHSNYDHNQLQTNRLSQMQTQQQLQLKEALHAKMELEQEMEESRTRVANLESQLNDARRRSGQSNTRESSFSQISSYRDSLSPEAAAIALARSPSTASATTLRRASPPVDALPSPPPSVPLPPLPHSASTTSLPSLAARATSPVPSTSARPDTPHNTLSTTPDPALVKQIEERENRIRTVEKHLFAEKQLTATLEEALVDLETAQNKTRQDADVWRKKATTLEDELIGLRKERSSSRASLQAVEEEREMRVRAERARLLLEERMRGLEGERKKKKKGGLNCF